MLFLMIFIVIIFIIGGLIYFPIFLKRNPYYQHIEKIIDDKNLKSHKYSFLNEKGVKIVGKFYYYEQDKYKGLIINSHGMGNCKETQLPKLIEFIKDGYIVYSYDNMGVGESEGKYINGLTHSVLDLKDCLNNLSTIKELENYNICLYGHSWGGYAVSSIFNFDVKNKDKIKVIINKAGFNHFSDVFLALAKTPILKVIFYILLIPIYFYEMIFNLKTFNKTIIESLNKTNANVLMMYSYNDDKVVSEYSIEKYKKIKFNDNIKFLYFDKQNHEIDFNMEKIDTFNEIYRNYYDLKKYDYEPQYSQILLDGVDCNIVKEELNFINENINK